MEENKPEVEAKDKANANTSEMMPQGLTQC